MLDIYFADQNTFEIPEYPNENDHLGSIDLDEHKKLAPLFSECKKHGIQILYFEDSLIQPSQVKKILETFNENANIFLKDSKNKIVYDKFISILNKALVKNAGLVCFCD
jgi:c-di-AMP phosphodiesterase-like protein